MAPKAAQHHGSKHYGVDWLLSVTEHDDGHTSLSADRIQIILLQEIRQELKRLNALLHCENFQRMPRDLRDLAIEARAKRTARLARQRKQREGSK